MATDAYGKEWMTGENQLDNFIRNHKLSLVIEYITDNENGSCYFVCKMTNKSGNLLLDITQEYPLNDADILGMAKSIIRSQKIDKILYE